MRVRFEKYRLNVIEVMIGTPRATADDRHIDTVFEQLRMRQIARASYDLCEPAGSGAEGTRVERGTRDCRAADRADGVQGGDRCCTERRPGAAAARRGCEAEGTKVAEAERIRAIGDAEATRTRGGRGRGTLASKAQSDALGGRDAALRRLVAQLMADAVRHARPAAGTGHCHGRGPYGRDRGHPAGHGGGKRGYLFARTINSVVTTCRESP